MTMKILAVDDIQDNLIVLRAVLSDKLPDAVLLTASNGEEGLSLARAEDPDVILLDIVMPGMDGYEVCRRLKKDPALQAIPVLFLTSLKTDRDSRIKALEVGAEGFLTKPFDEAELVAQIHAMVKIKVAALLQRDDNERLSSLVAERTKELEHSQRVTLRLLDDLKAENEARKKSERIARESEANYRALFREMLDGFVLFELMRDAAGHPSDYRFLTVNPVFERIIGVPVQTLIGKSVRETSLLTPEQVQAHLDIYAQVVQTGKPAFFSGYFEKRKKYFEVTAFRSTPEHFACIYVDVTERKRALEAQAELESQLQQAQKMESVGRLAGGVAHDFNNMLGVILGNAEMALLEVKPASPVHTDLVEIKKAAERSADLARQLLAFARKQTVAPKVLDLNMTVEGMSKMLERLIGESVKLEWRPQTGLWPVKVDPSQIDQILANLCVNARDAIDEVGAIVVSTANCTLSGERCVCEAGISPGDYVLLSVKDNGKGMDEDTKEHIFEPFFTTKPVGQGTGLGLATVYGIVQQNEGFIRVESSPAQGTAFKIYLPRYRGAVESESSSDVSVAAALQGTETVLLVEDEPSMLALMKKVIAQFGYTVLCAETPAGALSLAKQFPGQIHLLVTDVVMPEMNGRDLSKQLQILYPSLKCLFMSGYTSDVIAHHGVLDPDVHFIQKPVSLTALAQKVREAIAAPDGHSPRKR